MKRFIVIFLLISLWTPLFAEAKIDLSGPIAPPTGSGMNLPKDPTELLDKAVNSLPKTDEELKAVGEKIKESLGTETGQRVRGVLKDIGRAFVWATELMVKGIKYLIGKL
ncbi:MAG: hypothetical protein Q7R62_01545 [bacterium]|nr:hypothetical protein [bacterium]